MDSSVRSSTLRKVIADGLPRAEQEVLINRCGDEAGWVITTSHPPTARKMARLAESYGVEGVLLNKYTYRVTLPLSAVSFRRSREITAPTEEENDSEHDDDGQEEICLEDEPN